MDFTLIEKIDFENICYKLLKTNFYRNYYVIVAQNKREFYCGSICSSRDEAINLFEEIAYSNTDVCCIADVLEDFMKQKI